MVDNNAKEAKGLGHSRGRPGLARDVIRADIRAQEWVGTGTHMADGDRNKSPPKTKDRLVLGPLLKVTDY
jgi:hypothetical protein